MNTIERKIYWTPFSSHVGDNMSGLIEFEDTRNQYWVEYVSDDPEDGFNFWWCDFTWRDDGVYVIDGGDCFDKFGEGIIGCAEKDRDDYLAAEENGSLILRDINA